MIKNTVLIVFLVLAIFVPGANSENIPEGAGAAVSPQDGAAPFRLAQAQQSGASAQDWKPGLQTGQNTPAGGQPPDQGAQPAIPPQNVTPMSQGMGNMDGMAGMSGSSAAMRQQNAMPMMGHGMGMGRGGMGCMMGGMGMGNMSGMGNMGAVGNPGSTGTTGGR